MDQYVLDILPVLLHNRGMNNEQNPIEQILLEKNWFDLKTLKVHERQSLLNHIEVHRYLLCKEASADIPWLDAVESWFMEVWQPISRIAEQPGYQKKFGDKTKLELYLSISEHWHYMKSAQPEMTATEAVEHYSRFIGS
ncbi:hypothetical protein EXM22_10890 [Oceanispirochaeta crateris]|uniref:Uncharacterized protein n=1 Tax=Oceanispirochaeta crateris TaxID=2518645 RepID=A0A5C1QPG3_9SPIO|nr:hypothetical protein [Oceanispirochaeta crateris]QEN08466.1 hypothetical protein EXM22_10890 [Oceanispirochaeta crateris]